MRPRAVRSQKSSNDLRRLQKWELRRRRSGIALRSNRAVPANAGEPVREFPAKTPISRDYAHEAPDELPSVGLDWPCDTSASSWFTILRNISSASGKILCQASQSRVHPSDLVRNEAFFAESPGKPHPGRQISHEPKPAESTNAPPAPRTRTRSPLPCPHPVPSRRDEQRLHLRRCTTAGCRHRAGSPQALNTRSKEPSQ